MAHEFIAVPADSGLVDLARFKADRGSSGEALQHLESAVTARVGTDCGQEPRGQHLLGSGQAAKEMVIGMVLEKSLDLFPILVQLLLERAQQFAQAQGQLAFGFGDRSRGFELVGLRENRQALLDGFWTPKPVGVQELLPATFARFGQCLWSWKLQDKIPSGGTDPVLEGFQRRRVILDQRLLELVDQERALRDQGHLIAAEQTQLSAQFIRRLERPPSLAIHSQG